MPTGRQVFELVITPDMLADPATRVVITRADGSRWGIADGPGLIRCSEELTAAIEPKPPEPTPIQVKPYDRLSPAQKFESLRELTGTTPEQIVQQALTDAEQI